MLEDERWHGSNLPHPGFIKLALESANDWAVQPIKFVSTLYSNLSQYRSRWMDNNFKTVAGHP
jgi:hypothetical protein